jgi:DNA repair protein RadA/Sms
MVEEVVPGGPSAPGRTGPMPRTILLGEVSPTTNGRLRTGVEEFDRVMGGGIVTGSVTLVAGDPGIGKSTLMTEVAALVAKRGVLYVCGEESPEQVRLRADRLEVDGSAVHLLPETDADAVVRAADALRPAVLIVDSIQTLYRGDIQSAPGSVAQVRECTATIMRHAKQSGTAVFVVGHVTKEGTIAGPRVLEHMVDTVLHLEGDRHHAFRVLRAVKNRFGSTNEIGVFEMQGTGLRPVANPSEIFLSERSEDASGSAVVCTLEGTRPVLAEIQALVTPTSYPSPQRTATGFDGRRLQMLLAVLEKREGLRLSTQDVFVNVAGGLRLSEPAVDLGIVMAVVSSFKDRPLPRHTVVLGEVGLGGEIRSVSQLPLRLREVGKLGFRTAVVPAHGLNGTAGEGLPETVGVSRLSEAADRLF